ncbi:MAG TPA: BREX-1 system adenine-specific DNA-methyltransferase PglX [Candidatus Merdivicinus excrementipullorum]|uniref:site-specific DNA-methyltransferase (adenine-specific) n=1 Tax=Candidatus Merdivicinus excrementipullorum TaxID=2840867 RepID=A0A9D1K1Q8_9FIRM|nr:BREX-1 system adenine-specific DNA-methyltransferase PglX [Candidatus Merdivicinus excrementipullorum]HIZ54818.1 BREX-1 system adenine-specific DNA-methyltransferase PglX [Bacillota bacterium]
MNKSAIQKFAIWARTELIAQVSQRAFQYGITAEDYGDANAATVNGQALTPSEQAQRRELVSEIQQKDYHQVMEEVAYTWFNRFIALRFMEVNNYLPSHIRVFSDSTGAFKPEILNDALHLELPGLDREKIADFIEKNQTEDLYRYLLLTQCNALNEAMPRMFERMGSYTELLLPNNILKADGILGRMVTDIPEEDWTDQVQIIGWLYQYYISERHEAVVDPLKGKIIQSKDVPAATQIFTTDWVVRYMVENSLGRYWIERHPESKLADKLQFFVKPKNGEITHINEPVKPQELTFFDPCMGSGHILVYAFEVLMEIYKECGYGERDAVAEILQNNLFGLDIDERCSQLAYFAVMMKARSYDRRFLSRGIEPQVYYPQKDADLVQFCSLLQVKDPGKKPREPEELTLFYQNYEVLLNDWNCRRLLSQKYAVVCTNPPYLNRYDAALKKFVTERYKDYSSDLFSVFIYRNFDFCKKGGYSALMTPNVWMFIKSYEKLRGYIIRNKWISGLVQMAKGAFFKEATVDICSFIFQNAQEKAPGLYFRLEDFKGDMEVQREKVLEAIENPDCGYFYEAKQSNFSKIPGSPVAYWVSKKFTENYTNKSVGDFGDVITGMTIGDNNRYLRLWYEININNAIFNAKSMNEIDLKKTYWIPYSKGGPRRNWYGNYEYLVNWSQKDNFNRSKTTLQHLYLHDGITWPFVTSGDFSARILPLGFLWDVAGSPCFFQNESIKLYVLGAMCSKAVNYILKVVNPTINVQAIDVSMLPLPDCGDAYKTKIINTVSTNCKLSQFDWDSFETSWDFKKHPLI